MGPRSYVLLTLMPPLLALLRAPEVVAAQRLAAVAVAVAPVLAALMAPPARPTVARASRAGRWALQLRRS